MTAAQDSRALKPCPFCGATPTLEGSGKIRWIKCPGGSACGTSGMAMGISADDLDRGVEAWNRRAALSAGHGVIDSEIVRLANVAIAESIGMPMVQDWMYCAIKVCSHVAAAPQQTAQEHMPLTDAQISEYIECAHGITGE